jgi:hypothetical protein
MKPSFRDGIAQAVEQVLKELNSQGVQIEVDTADDNGELITYYDKGVIITLCHTFELSPGILDFALFTADIKVYGPVSIKLNSKNVKIACMFRNLFTKLYTPLFRLIQEQKKEYGFKKAFNQLVKGVESMSFDIEKYDFQVMSYLTRKGFDIPDKFSELKQFVNELRTNNQEVYNEMITVILEANDFVENLSKEMV